MSFANLKTITEQAPERSAQGNNARNVPLRVISYDLEKNSVTGTDIYTGEQMTISLRPDPQAATRAFKRSDVLEFAGKGKQGRREKTYTEEGGVLMFDLVYPDPKADGALTAKWARPYSHDDKEAEVFVAYAAPFVANSGKFAMDVLHTMAAAPVTTVEELKLRITDALFSDFAGAVVRISDGSETLLFTRGYEDRIGRSKKVDGKFKTLTGDEAFEDFLATPFGKALASSLGTADGASSQDFVAEVIPVERIYAGKDTQVALKSRENFEAFHKMGTSVGFCETVIPIRRHTEGGAFLCARPLPVHLRADLYAMKDVPTVNIQPKVQPFVNNASGEVSDANMEDAAAGAVDEVSAKLAAAGRAMSK